MTDEDISHYLPRFGDRVALKAYSKLQEESRHHGSSTERKLSLREKLVAKLQGKQKSSSEHRKRAVPQSGNMNAKKNQKKNELGWLHEYEYGGGTRTLEIQLDCKIGDIMPVAQEVFFPGGYSKKGAITDFCFHIADQTHTKLDMAQTFRELFDNTKLKHLRLYMVTCQPQMVQECKETKVEDSEDNSNQMIEMSPINAIESLTDSSDLKNPSCSCESLASINVSEPGEILIEGYSPGECHSSPSEIFSIEDCTVASSELNRNVESENNDMDSNDILQQFLLRSVEFKPNSASNNSLAVIRIHRAVVLNGI